MQPNTLYKLTSLKVGSRASPLALAQVEEVIALMGDQEIEFEKILINTTGDLDLATCLKGLDKTDFFTREIDRAVLDRTIDIAIHSAKDLPDPLPEGLKIFAITKGVDPSDSLVLNKPLESLKDPVFGTSSLRRDLLLKELFPTCTIVSIRGTIEKRLERLNDLDGVVVAEAALIRLNLTSLYRITLPGETAPFQGKLAIVGRKEDQELEALFKPLNG